MLQAIQNILETVGQTPVVKIRHLADDSCANIYAKYEVANPSYSIKDRIAGAMIQEAVSQGKIDQNTEVVVATSGNSGVSLALVCAVLKYKLTIFIPEDATFERRKMLESFGVQTIQTPASLGLKGALKQAQDYVQGLENACLLDQFDSPANVRAHQQETAREILSDFSEGIDALVSGVGTGGTLTGVARTLKQENPHLKVIAVEPSGSNLLSGGLAGGHKIPQLGVGFIPKNLDQSLIDEVISVSDEQAYKMTRDLSSKEGLLVGLSSGANVYASSLVAKRFSRDQKIITFLCDAGQRYFSIEKYFNQEGIKK